MGALGHYLEREDLATASVSLIRRQTEAMKPPRALWVPFELGRPFGAPNEPDFQRRVVRALLSLIEAKSGPVLEDFDEDPPGYAAADDDTSGWACPVELKPMAPEAEDDATASAQALLREIQQMRPWYDLCVSERGRSTVGASDLDIEDIARFVTGFLGEDWPEAPFEDMPRGESFKHACQDLQAYYQEAVAAQPGQAAARSGEVVDWFWNETTAGAILKRLESVCAASDDAVMQHMAAYLLLPRSQTGSVGDGSDGRMNPEYGTHQSYQIS